LTKVEPLNPSWWTIKPSSWRNGMGSGALVADERVAGVEIAKAGTEEEPC
jgi:hypothetical protein